MKKILIAHIVIFNLFQISILSGQNVKYEGLFKGLDGKELMEVIAAVAKEAVIKYAPEFYREYKEPYLSGGGAQFTKDSYIYYYSVVFFYDPVKENMREDFAASVLIDSKTGKVTDILLGNGTLLTGLDKADDKNIVPISYVPIWSEGYYKEHLNSRSVEEYVEDEKNVLLWGLEKDDMKNRRAHMEKVFMQDSLKKELLSTIDLMKKYKKKDNGYSEFQLQKRERIIDSLDIQYHNILRERKKYNNYME